MPTHKDVTSLRKNGQLDEAFKLAQQLLAVHPDDIWVKRAMGWVRYERLKLVAKVPDPKLFVEEWNALSALVAADPAQETMLTEKCGWQAISRIHALELGKEANNILDIVFGSLQLWTWQRPSDLYSGLLAAFVKSGAEWPGLKIFFSWWQLSNLQSADYMPPPLTEGRKSMSLAEKAHIAYAKCLLKTNDPVQVRAFVEQLDQLSAKHPEYQYPLYYKAKLLAGIGAKEEALKALVPFARRKQQEFWIWELLADMFPDEPEKIMACLCRALLCPADEKFVSSLRIRVSRMFNMRGEMNAAFSELDKALKIRREAGWKIAQENDLELNLLRQRGAHHISDEARISLYKKFSSIAEEVLYVDIQEQIGVVTHLNTEKKIAHFIVSKTVSAHFNYAKKMSRIQPGDFVSVQLDKREGKEGVFWTPVSVKPTQQQPSKEVYSFFEGPLKRLSGKDFGFVGDVFISPEMLKKMPSEMNGNVKVRAFLSFDKMKKMHKWKAFHIEGI